MVDQNRCSVLLVLALLVACSREGAGVRDGHTLVGARNYLTGYPARDGDSVNVVVEIPAGTNAKWEVDKVDGAMRWQIKDGKPRVVNYLAYPANYGMVPRTLLPKELGGDGDPLDVLLLGSAMPRGSVVKARLLGVLKLLDGGEQDDKLIALAEDAPMQGVADLAELNVKYPGVTEILERFMTGYKGPGEIVSNGSGDAAEAERILDAAIAAYTERSDGG